VSHRDDPARRLAGRPNHHDHLGVESSDGLVSEFSVILAVILDRQRPAFEKLPGVGEIKVPILQGFLSFLFVKFQLHW
jgi:hypothetical protein